MIVCLFVCLLAGLPNTKYRELSGLPSRDKKKFPIYLLLPALAKVCTIKHILKYSNKVVTRKCTINPLEVLFLILSLEKG